MGQAERFIAFLFVLALAATPRIATAHPDDQCQAGDQRACETTTGGAGTQDCNDPELECGSPCTAQNQGYGTDGCADTCPGEVPCCRFCYPVGGCAFLFEGPANYDNQACVPDDETEDLDDPEDPLDDPKDPAEPCHYRGNPVSVIGGNVTFAPRVREALFDSPDGEFDLGRRYSSRNVFLARKGRFGAGWYDTFSVEFSGRPVFQTYSQETGTWSLGYLLYTFVHPDGTSERVILPRQSFPSFTFSRGATYTSPGTIRTRGGTSYVFDVTISSSGTDSLITTGVLRAVIEPDGTRYDLDYYHAPSGGSDPCATEDTTLHTRLCRAQRGATTARFFYDPQSKQVSRTELYRVDHLVSTTTYAYSALAGLDRNGQPNSAGWLPTRVETYDGATFVGAEAYEYTDRSYVRPDLPSDNPYFGPSKRIYGYFGSTLPLLRRATDGFNNLISGHDYDASGRGATSYRPGEFLRLEYYRLGPQQGRVLVHNESLNTIVEYAIEGGTISAVSDACATLCSTPPATYVRQNRRVVAAVRSGSVATRTTYQRDARGRIILTQGNWNGAVDELGALSTPENPRTAERTAYVSLTDDRIAATVTVFGALCAAAPNAVFGLNCPAGTYESPSTSFDYDADFDAVFNETPAPKLSQISRRGYTLLDPQTGVVGLVERTTQFAYDGDRISSSTTAQGTPEARVISYTYQPESVWPGAGQLATVVVNGVVTRETTQYDTMGRPLYQRDAITNTVYTYGYNFGRRPPWIVAKHNADGSELQWLSFQDAYGHELQNMVLATGDNSTIVRENTYDSAVGAQYVCVPGQLESNPGSAAIIQSQCVAALGRMDRVVSQVERVKNNGASQFVRAQSQYDYDATGHRVAHRALDPGGALKRTSRTSYDAHGKLERAWHFVGDIEYVTDYFYDDRQRLVATTSGRSGDRSATHDANFPRRDTTYSYDALDRLIAVTRGYGTAAAATTRYTYDPAGNLATMTDGDGRVTRYAYDDFGALIAVASPDSGVTRYAYDALGRVRARFQTVPAN